MTKSELVEQLAIKHPSQPLSVIDEAVKAVLEHMISRLEQGDRVEIRGFGSFSLHYRHSRLGRNPKTGERVALSAKYVPYFKAGKELKLRVDPASSL